MSSFEMSISCQECVRRSTPDCSDCLVTFVLGGEPDEMTLSPRLANVATLLTQEGMVPSLRYRPRGVAS
jgi:hypothetical protein